MRKYNGECTYGVCLSPETNCDECEYFQPDICSYDDALFAVLKGDYGYIHEFKYIKDKNGKSHLTKNIKTCLPLTFFDNEKK